MNIHIEAVHEEKKQLKCDICDAKYAQKSNLNTHAAVHDVKKALKCDTCYTKFAFESAYCFSS